MKGKGYGQQYDFHRRTHSQVLNYPSANTCEPQAQDEEIHPGHRCASLSCSVWFLLFGTTNPILISHFFAEEIIYTGISLLCIIAAFPASIIPPLRKWIKARWVLYKSVGYLFLGLLASLFITYWSANVAQSQMDIANRETAPQLTVSTFEENGSKYYEVSNAKGMATYVSLHVREKYYFPYNGEGCEVGLQFPVQLDSDTVQLDSRNSSIRFLQECSDFDGEKVFVSLDNYIRKCGVNPGMLSEEREITVEFWLSSFFCCFDNLHALLWSRFPDSFQNCVGGLILV